jgi:hypothetical protein
MTPGKVEIETAEVDIAAEESRPRFQPIKLRDASGADASLRDSRYRLDYYEDEPMPESDGVNPLQIQQCRVVLEQVEKTGKSPIPLEWFRDDALLHSYKFDWLESAEFRQRVIDKSIEEGVIKIGSIPNGLEGEPPVTTIASVKAELPQNGKRFNPITVRGEPVSVSMMRDRGRY